MGKIDDACRELVTMVDGSLACGVVDLDTGLLLGVHNAAPAAPAIDESVAAAAMDLFCGEDLGRVEQLARAHGGVPADGSPSFHEIHITSARRFHFVKTVRGGRAVILLVTRRTTNIGLGWAHLKAALPALESLVP